MHFDDDSDGPKNAHRMLISMADAARCMLDVISCTADDCLCGPSLAVRPEPTRSHPSGFTSRAPYCTATGGHTWHGGGRAVSPCARRRAPRGGTAAVAAVGHGAVRHGGGVGV